MPHDLADIFSPGEYRPETWWKNKGTALQICYLKIWGRGWWQVFIFDDNFQDFLYQVMLES